MPTPIPFAHTTPRKPPRRSLGDMLQELALIAPAQLVHIQGIVEWLLEQAKNTPAS